MTEYRYYRWAGRIVRHPEGRIPQVEMIEAMEWIPAPAEVAELIAGLDPEDTSPSAWCARLSQREAQRMVEALGGHM